MSSRTRLSYRKARDAALAANSGASAVVEEPKEEEEEVDHSVSLTTVMALSGRVSNTEINTGIACAMARDAHRAIELFRGDSEKRFISLEKNIKLNAEEANEAVARVATDVQEAFAYIRGVAARLEAMFERLHDVEQLQHQLNAVSTTLRDALLNPEQKASGPLCSIAIVDGVVQVAPPCPCSREGSPVPAEPEEDVPVADEEGVPVRTDSVQVEESK